MTPPYGVGIVGTGDIFRVYAQNLGRYPDIVRVTGCAGRDPERARRRADELGLPRAYGSVAELLADPEVDIVLDLATPDAHASVNLAAVRAGKHVYTEKPLAATFAQARDVVDAAQAAGLRVGGAPDTFLGSRLQTCRALLDEGRLGAVVGASAFVVSHGHEWHHPSPAFFYQPGAGPLMDIGPYYVQALLSLLGPVDAVAGMASRTYATRTIESEPLRGERIPVDVDTHVTGTLRFASGAIGTVIASFDVWDSELPRLEVYGTQGTILLDDIDPLDGPNLFGGAVRFRDAEHARWRGMPRPPREAWPGWEEVEQRHPFASTSHADNARGVGLVDMAYAIRDRRPERAGGAMALHAVEVMEGVHRSADEGRFITMTTTFERPAPLPVDWPAGEGR
jgi:predicted dehydrogenase